MYTAANEMENGIRQQHSDQVEHVQQWIRVSKAASGQNIILEGWGH
jgi:hypothetical protein